MRLVMSAHPSGLTEAAPQSVEERLEDIFRHRPLSRNDQHFGRHARDQFDVRVRLPDFFAIDVNARQSGD